jgi:predicted nucleic acid-binding protein
VKVVDTNVLAGLFVEGPFSANARALYGLDADWRSEPFILIEFTNVLATQIRVGRLTRDAGAALVDRAQAVLADGLHEVEHATALAVAARLSISAYDARFLCVALALGSKLVTEDTMLRRKAPGQAISIADALAA